jgi:hypothetical protein
LFIRFVLSLASLGKFDGALGYRPRGNGGSAAGSRCDTMLNNFADLRMPMGHLSWHLLTYGANW